MSKRSLYIAAYDIASPARLRRALKMMRNYATGGQKSVFECYLSATERQTLLLEIQTVLEQDEDRFLLFRVDARRDIRVLGIAVLPTDPDYFYVG